MEEVTLHSKEVLFSDEDDETNDVTDEEYKDLFRITFDDFDETQESVMHQKAQ